MKIAISSTGKGLTSSLDPRFGRAPYILIVDDQSRSLVDVIDNTSAADAAHGAGINAATAVAQAGANIVLTGRVGPKAFAVLEAAGIKVVSGLSGSVSEAVDSYLSGSAAPLAGPDSDAHPDTPGRMSGMGGSGAGRGKGGGRGMGMGGGRCRCGKK